MKRNAPPEADSDTWFISVLWEEFITLPEHLLLMDNELYIFLSEQDLHYPLIWASVFVFIFISITSERERDKFTPL